MNSVKKFCILVGLMLLLAVIFIIAAYNYDPSNGQCSMENETIYYSCLRGE